MGKNHASQYANFGSLPLLPLGDPDEFMLGKAISLITGINRSARSMNTLSQPIMRGESVYQSTERHATGGMLMVPEEKNN